MGTRAYPGNTMLLLGVLIPTQANAETSTVRVAHGVSTVQVTQNTSTLTTAKNTSTMRTA